MELSLFDLHCDTAYEMYRQAQHLTHNSLAISLESAEKFKHYYQVMALWTNHRLSNEDGWNVCLAMHRGLCADEAISHGKARLQTACPDLKTTDPSPILFLGVEDARILNGHEERVDLLYQMGVRFFTPLWKGESCIGGAYDTKVGLTDFGKRAISRAVQCGMLLDLSHASEKSAQDILEIAARYNRPVLASHSNAYEICPASRNLHRRQADAILNCGGVVGLNLYPAFLRQEQNACLEDLLRHIEYFLELGFSMQLCLGCDMDGADLPSDIHTVADLFKLAELLLSHNYPEQFVHNLFFANAYRFASLNL